MIITDKRAKFHGGVRPPTYIKGIVLHGLASGTPEAGVRYIVEPGDGRQVSYHRIFMSNGDITELVPDNKLAWHCKDWNTHTLGWCLGTTNKKMAPNALISFMSELDLIIKKYGIKWVRLHSSINPKKIDPGAVLDWIMLAKFCAVRGCRLITERAK